MKTRIGFVLLLLTLALVGDGPWVSLSRSEERAKNIVDLQPFSRTVSSPVQDSTGREGLATLVNLNPNINAWYLLDLTWQGSPAGRAFHLENSNRKTQSLLLDPRGVVLSEKGGNSLCDLWGSKPPEGLQSARDTHLPYAPLCATRLYLRNPTIGHQTPVEKVTDFLRKKVPHGEEIVVWVRDTVFAHLYEEKAERKVPSKPAEGPPPKASQAPVPALLDPKQGNLLVKPVDLGITVQGAGPDGLILGNWYPARGNPGIYVSIIIPKAIAPDILGSYKKWVNDLNRVELGELVYLVAFDLDQFNLHYALGTNHPSLGWSPHIPPQMKDKSLSGPDGINTAAPLIRTGLVNPMDRPHTVATFTGGFKRFQGAFRYGPLALKNHGSHYGFLENGVIFSRLQPELATIFVFNDGEVEMKTWTEMDNRLLPLIRYARQNGVPIIDGFDPATRLSVPGPLVAHWGPGNWSGSADDKLQALRAGAALQESGGKRFLLYAFFWSATPSAMARVFQAYQCRYALLLDMNALVHTYLAVYPREGSNLYIQHLIRRMNEIDLADKGRVVPRFLGYADDRDFFYLTRKESP